MEISLNALKNRAHALGIRGNNGGWITIGKRSIQGWDSVLAFVVERYSKLDEARKEVADDRRIGIPTLCRDLTNDMVAALISKREVSLRYFDMARN